MKRGAWFVKCVVAMVIAIFFFAWVTYLLWNWLVPVLFNGPIISYWQALGLLALTKILFFGIRGRRPCYGPGTHQPPWKNRFYEKISSLSPEEREAFKQKMREKWCTPGDKEELWCWCPKNAGRAVLSRARTSNDWDTHLEKCLKFFS